MPIVNIKVTDMTIEEAKDKIKETILAMKEKGEI